MSQAGKWMLVLATLASAVGCVGEGDWVASEEEHAETPGVTPPAGSAHDCQVLVVGGGTGGVAAALAATRTGAEVCLTEETHWLGGQFTAQGLNASDENKHIDKTGATRSYRELRALMRAAYGGKSNPGGCWVSYLCAEPSVALHAIRQLTKPAIDAGKLRVFYDVVPASVQTAADRVTGVTFRRVADGQTFQVRAQQTIDATELGDVIQLSGAAYRVGQEPRSDTGEADAPEAACSDCVQAFTYCVALEKRPSGESHVIPKPPGYGVKPWMKGYHHGSFPMFGPGSVWSYRRMVDGAALGRTDLSIMNWSDGNDYPFGNILDKSPEEVQKHLAQARDRARGYVYWLQTEAGGSGYPYLKPRGDVFGTSDGLAKYPYIREGRRLKALVTIRTEDISDFYVKGQSRARQWPDSGGIGFYPIDMHENAAPGSGFARGHSLPFQIPIGALIPEKMDGLLAGAKNLGTTHITNSAYRLHPIEWAVGEAAGTLAAMSVSWGKEPREAYAHEGNLRELQRRLLADGMPLYWTDDVLPSDADWADIQFVATLGIMGGPEASTLKWRPDLPVNRAQVSDALVRALALEIATPTMAHFSDVPKTFWAFGAIETLVAKGIVSGTAPGKFSPHDPVTYGQLRLMIQRVLGDALASAAVPMASMDTKPMSRRAVARALARVVAARLSLP